MQLYKEYHCYLLSHASKSSLILFIFRIYSLTICFISYLGVFQTLPENFFWLFITCSRQWW